MPQQRDQESHREHGGQDSRGRKFMCSGQQPLGHGEERDAAESEHACAAMDRHFGEQGPGEIKNAAEAAFKYRARWSLRALS